MKSKLYFIILLAALIMIAGETFAQNTAINEDNSDAHHSAALDVQSSDKGLLMPRMTEEEVAAIDDPANGLIVYCTTDEKFYSYVSSENLWKEIAFVIPWACGDPFTDDRDGQTYNTVQIGTQCWMAENLNIGTMISGSSNQTDNSTIEKYCYNDNSSNCDTYGGLYQWDEMMQYITTEGAQGICPTGWHVPSDDEWKFLEGNVDSQYGIGNGIWEGTGFRGFDAGKNLQTVPDWSSGTDLFDFSALPGGIRWTNGLFYDLNSRAYFWTSSQGFANSRYLVDTYDSVNRSSFGTTYGLSVRCLKN